MTESPKRASLVISLAESAARVCGHDWSRGAVLLHDLAAVLGAADEELAELCRQPYELTPEVMLPAMQVEDPVAATDAAVEDFRRMGDLVAHVAQVIGTALDQTVLDYRPFLALAFLRRLIAINPALHPIFAGLQSLATRSGEARLVVDLLDKAGRCLPGLDTNVVVQVGVENWLATAARIARGRRRGLPGILFNTVPKSGSMYVSSVLEQGLDLPLVPVAVASYTLRDHVVPAWSERLRRGGAISQEHIDPSPANVAGLRASGTERLIVHLRDPRQATLSNLHHVAKRYQEVAGFMEPIYPEAYPGWSREEQAAWMVDHYFPELIRWVRGWVVVADDPASGLEVHFTHYEELHRREENIIEEILDFYGIPREAFDWQINTKRDEKTHFRRGLVDEWREVFTAEQQQRMWHLIPPDIATRFAWTQ